MPKKDKDTTGPDPNSVLIPREMTERKKLLTSSNLMPRPLTPEQAAALQRFEVLPANPISDDEEGRDFHLEEDEDEDDNEKGRHKRHRAKDPSKERFKSGVCPKCGRSAQSSKVTVTGENYLHLYMEQQKQTLEQQMQMNLSEAGKSEAAKTEEKKKETERLLEKRREDDTRIRAHQLQDQITYWNQQKGQGAYDDATIAANLSPLENELNSISSIYWK